jgi:hypothetical protein
MPIRTNTLRPQPEPSLLPGQLPLDFSKAAPSKPATSNAVRELPSPSAPPRCFTRREAAAYIRCSLRFLDGLGLPFIRKGRCKVYDRIDLDAICSRISAEGGPGRRLYGP